MRFQKRLLGRMQVGAVKRRSARHAAHGKYLQFDPLPVQIRIGLIPINLSFHTPVVTLRNASLPHQKSQCDLAVVYILANRPLGDRTPRQFPLHPYPDAMRSVALLARSFSIAFQNRIDKLNRCFQFPSRTLGLFPRLGQRARDRFPHHPAVHSHFLRHSCDRPASELILSPDLFE